MDRLSASAASAFCHSVAIGGPEDEEEEEEVIVATDSPRMLERANGILAAAVSSSPMPPRRPSPQTKTPVMPPDVESSPNSWYASPFIVRAELKAMVEDWARKKTAGKPLPAIDVVVADDEAAETDVNLLVDFLAHHANEVKYNGIDRGRQPIAIGVAHMECRPGETLTNAEIEAFVARYPDHDAFLFVVLRGTVLRTTGHTVYFLGPGRQSNVKSVSDFACGTSDDEQEDLDELLQEFLKSSVTGKAAPELTEGDCDDFLDTFFAETK